MNVEENLLFISDNKTLANELLDITELKGLAKRNVRTLSGGQQQRVALCRAMMKKPKLLLMDEPFSALHPTMRKKLHTELKALHQRFGTTTIMVSHDVAEVYALADRVLVLAQGKVVSDGKVEDVLKAQRKEVEILSISNSLATVSVAGELLEVKVALDTKVGESIELEIKEAQ
jgi:molybdate transport system ATP-binding protein